MANRVHLANADEAEICLLRMVNFCGSFVAFAIDLISYGVCTLQIEEKEIFATINQQDGMISFHDTPQDLGTSISILQELEDNMAKCMRLDERMQIMNHSLAVNKSLIQKVRELSVYGILIYL